MNVRICLPDPPPLFGHSQVQHGEQSGPELSPDNSEHEQIRGGVDDDQQVIERGQTNDPEGRPKGQIQLGALGQE